VPRLAIVISAVGSVESLEGTLVSVLENRPADCEIVVVLNGPYADPYDLAEEVRFIPPGRSQSTVEGINRGLAATRAPFVHLLASGCLVSEGWADAALARFGDRQVGSVVPLVWEADRADRIFAAGVGYRRHGRRYLVGAGLEALDSPARQSIIGPCGFAAFYRKAALDFAGGFSTQLGPRQADADLALMLRQAGFSVAIEPGSSMRARAEADPDVGGFRQALCDERLFRRNLIGPGRAGAILAHWGQVGLELAGSIGQPRMLAQLAGRLLGCCEPGGYARHHRALAQMAARSVQPAAAGERVRIDGSHRTPAHKEAGRTRLQVP
jgi:Glycosyltransferase like family 2